MGKIINSLLQFKQFKKKGLLRNFLVGKLPQKAIFYVHDTVTPNYFCS